MKFLSQINVNTEYTLPIVDGTNGQVLATDGNGTVYWGSIAAGVTTLDGLTDVILTSPSSGQLLRYGIPPGSGETQPVWYNFTPNYLTPSSSIDNLGDVTITSATAGQILQWNGTAWVNATLSTVEYVSKVQHIVKAGVAISKGQAVYVTGADGTNMIVGLASNAAESTSSKVIGLAASNAAINDQIFVVTEGLIAGLNTSTATAGDPVWLGTNGNLIFGLLNKPVAPAHLVYIGVVTRVQQNNGEIFVNVQNGFELNEIHDALIVSPTVGQLLRRDSDNLWKNWTPNYLTAESDTLATVTARGATTTGNITVNGAAFATSFSATGLLITNADTSGSLQPDQGSPANKIYSFRWAGNEQGYIDTDAKITFAGFKTPTGTASQFLKANGTIDSNTYLTTASAASLYTTYDYVDDEIASVNTYVNNTFVPKTRTLTINGTAFDLSANRSWTIATTDSTKVSKSGESHDTVLPDTLAAGDGGFYTVASGYGPSGGNDALIHVPYVNNLWAHQIAMDWATGDSQDMWFRTKHNGTWQSWKKVWHDGNFTPSNYQLASTAINTGNIATQSVAYATSSGNSNLLKSLGSYVWSASTNGRDFQEGMQISFVRQADGYQNYGSVVRIHTYPNDGASAELYFPYSEDYGGNSMQYRLGLFNNAGWSSWKTVVDSENIGLYALTSLPAHTHTIANVTGLQTALDGKLSTSGKAADSELLDGVDESRFVYGNSNTRRGTNLISNWNQSDYPDVAFLSAEAGGSNAPNGDYTYGLQYSFHRSGAAYRTQIATSLYSDSSVWVRNSRDSDVWTSWKRLWHSGDFTSTNVTNWNTAYGWGNHASAGYLTSLPSHNHDDRYYTESESDSRYFIKSGSWLGDLASYGYTREVGIQMTGGSEFVILSKAGQGYTLVDGSYLAYEGGGFYSSNNSAGNTLLGFYADTTSSVNFNTSSVKANGNTIWHAGNDGSGSGLDADLLDGNHASAFATRQDGARYTTNFNSILSSGFFNAEGQPANAPDDYGQLIVAKGIDTGLQIFGGYDSNNLWFRGWGYGPEADGFYPWRKVWHDGNDGSGSGLDADLLDGNHASAFALASHNHDDRYYTESESDSRFVNTAGDTMSGNLTLRYSTADTDGYNALTFADGSDDYIIKASSSRGVFGRSSYGWHVNSASAFGIYSSGWVKLFGVEGDTGNTQVFGNLTVSGSITESSSIRYKKDIVDIESTSIKIEQLKPVRYKKIKDDQEEIGLIAEDVAELFPEVVKYDNEGRPDGVNYSRLSVILLKAVQELTERVNKLENK